MSGDSTLVVPFDRYGQIEEEGHQQNHNDTDHPTSTSTTWSTYGHLANFMSVVEVHFWSLAYQPTKTTSRHRRCQ